MKIFLKIANFFLCQGKFWNDGRFGLGLNFSKRRELGKTIKIYRKKMSERMAILRDRTGTRTDTDIRIRNSTERAVW